MRSGKCELASESSCCLKVLVISNNYPIFINIFVSVFFNQFFDFKKFDYLCNKRWRAEEEWWENGTSNRGMIKILSILRLHSSLACWAKLITRTFHAFIMHCCGHKDAYKLRFCLYFQARKSSLSKSAGKMQFTLIITFTLRLLKTNSRFFF